MSKQNGNTKKEQTLAEKITNPLPTDKKSVRLPDVLQKSAKLMIVPVTREVAMKYVENYHRHLGKPTATIFQIGCAIQETNILCGVAIVGTPIARLINDGWTLEVNRCCTDGTRNATSMLYGACWRTAKALGYRRLITYTHVNESGESLKGAGWKIVGEVKAQSWHRKSRPAVDKGPLIAKFKWEITSTDELGEPRSMIKVPMTDEEREQETTQLDLGLDLSETQASDL